uniref:Uncharacterized protein n=1 Tax=Chromera velia CCMP2878 TaxID=1169474 RepID=A0A0G4HUU0_9ALVE|eukprot:Cvel_8725.t1-p1 / transcript=Cvel_8725.t1 / gene=Cvel_8725 / organism=Chromera_velia_CCMP2878 / gene_product=hypothetical protein / transcript_product=hypothetical protein / location=Cvel_scaffold488:1116-2613(+) / protein_length=214 / sequence_SO=supercontig / SO=protein_coding / is_pseudo=false
MLGMCDDSFPPIPTQNWERETCYGGVDPSAPSFSLAFSSAPPPSMESGMGEPSDSSLSIDHMTESAHEQGVDPSAPSFSSAPPPSMESGMGESSQFVDSSLSMDHMTESAHEQGVDPSAPSFSSAPPPSMESGMGEPSQFVDSSLSMDHISESAHEQGVDPSAPSFSVQEEIQQGDAEADGVENKLSDRRASQKLFWRKAVDLADRAAKAGYEL